MGTYSTTLSLLTGGCASFRTKLASYELVIMDIQDKLLKEYAATKKEE
jgi:elongation factor G